MQDKGVAAVLDRGGREVRARPVATGWFVLLAAAELAYRALSPAHARALAAWASTDVDRLLSEPVGPLVVSAFVVLDHPVLWLVLAGAGLALLECRVGGRRTVVVATTSHVMGTAVSEGIVWWRVGHGRLPLLARSQLDVGTSYVVVGVLAALLVVGRPLDRVLAAVILVVLGPDLLDGLDTLDVAAVGHLTATVFGLACALAVRPRIAGRRGIRGVRGGRTGVSHTP